MTWNPHLLGQIKLVCLHWWASVITRFNLWSHQSNWSSPKPSTEMRLGFCCCCLFSQHMGSGLGLLLSTVCCHLCLIQEQFYGLGTGPVKHFICHNLSSFQCLKLCSDGRTGTLTHPFSSSSVTKDSRNATWRVSCFPLLLFCPALFYLFF